MKYQEWLDDHLKKHSTILKKLENKELEDIVEYFDFENMKREEEVFCLLYAQNKKCHNINNLNCYFCACPHFVFDDLGIETIKGKTIFSKCSINSKYGTQFDYENAIHQDCTNCTIPHNKNYIVKSLKYKK